MQARRDVGVGRGVRVFVWTFLALFAGFGLAGVDAWPFTAFHLFSHVRTDRFTEWQITTVDAAGAEHPGAADRTSIHLVSRLGTLSEPDRQAVCREWAAPGRVEVRIYSTVRSLRDPAKGERELRYACAP